MKTTSLSARFSASRPTSASVCYKPRPVSDADLKLMHQIDKLHMEFPFAGSRMLQGLLIQEGFKVPARCRSPDPTSPATPAPCLPNPV